MPYVKQSEREKLDDAINNVIKLLKDSSPSDLEGNVNYAISRIVLGAFSGNMPVSYKMFNRIGGTLNNVWQEIYRRLVAPYEEMSKSTNGDVTEYSQLLDYISKRY